MGSSGTRYPDIGDYALLSDCRSWALVGRHGGIDWCNFHEAESHPVVSRILDWDRGGRFEFAPADEVRTSSRRYLDDTLVLETTFETPTGVTVLTDALVVDDRSDPVHPVRVRPHGQLVRRMRCESGRVAVRMELSPRFDYGLTRPRLRLEGDGTRAVAYGAGDAVVIESDVPLETADWHTCCAETTLEAGQAWRVGLGYSLPHLIAEELREAAGDLDARLDDTVAFWRGWSARCTYEGPYRDAVLRSALVLKALTDAETGAIVAAPTTSLPEDPGGERNWDYRFTWIRDAAMHLEALFGLGYRAEAHAFVGYLARTTAGTAEDLQVLYGSRGERLVPELELDQLDGYRGSRPVRVGNAAAGQFQIDAFGQLLDTAWRFHAHGGGIDEEFCHLLSDAARIIAERWREPDRGIWEVRSRPQRFVSSQLFSWVGIDRAVRLADTIVLADDVATYRDLGHQIRQDLLDHGVDPTTGAFRRVVGGNDGEVDASNLMVSLEGLVDADDERVLATIEQVRERLGAGEGRHLLYRYRDEDGLSGGEGAFLLCSFWLVSALAAADRLVEAHEVFERTLGHANDLGLLAEQVDPATGALLGNFPQAISHAGLIDAALQLEAAAQRSSDRGEERPAPWASGEEAPPGRPPPQTPEPEAR